MSPRRLARLTFSARTQYLAEIGYVAERNPHAARKIATMIQAARQTLARFPNIGPAGLVPGTRRLVVGPYVLTVSQHHGEPVIIDFRHGRQTDKITDKSKD